MELMGIVDGNASHLHFQARLCRIWNCYDMFGKLKSRVSQLESLLLPFFLFENSHLKNLREWHTIYTGFLKKKIQFHPKQIKPSGKYDRCEDDKLNLNSSCSPQSCV